MFLFFKNEIYWIFCNIFKSIKIRRKLSIMSEKFRSMFHNELLGKEWELLFLDNSIYPTECFSSRWNKTRLGHYYPRRMNKLYEEKDENYWSIECWKLNRSILHKWKKNKSRKYKTRIIAAMQTGGWIGWCAYFFAWNPSWIFE